MKKKPIIIILAIISTVFIVGIIFYNCGVVVSGSECVDEYYLHKKDATPLSFFNFPGMGSFKRYKIWFMLGEKQKMLNEL